MLEKGIQPGIVSNASSLFQWPVANRNCRQVFICVPILVTSFFVFCLNYCQYIFPNMYCNLI